MSSPILAGTVPPVLLFRGFAQMRAVYRGKLPPNGLFPELFSHLHGSDEIFLLHGRSPGESAQVSRSGTGVPDPALFRALNRRKIFFSFSEKALAIPGGRCYNDQAVRGGSPAAEHAAVAQLDRVTGYEPVGRGFESLQPYWRERTILRSRPLFLSSCASVRAGVLALPADSCGSGIRLRDDVPLLFPPRPPPSGYAKGTWKLPSPGPL